MSFSNDIWIVVPAAGAGRRMGSKIPKQYLTLLGKTVLEITIEKLSALPFVKGIVVAVSESDEYFQAISWPSLVHRVLGGSERADSVLQGLQYLKAQGKALDWVLVHDAARPCVEVDNIINLVNSALQENCGAILASKIADTLKRGEGVEICQTVDRNNLWAAHTPQMFRVGELCSAIETALRDKIAVTDEASAIEYVGGKVLLIPDSRSNIKITQPEDLWLAEQILKKQCAH